jgi:sugar (pentulose or hexulose) kinase
MTGARAVRECVLTIDAGSSAIKGAAFDLAGREVMRSAKPVQAIVEAERAELTPEALLSGLREVISDLLETSLRPERIVLTGQMGSYVWVDEFGHSAGDILLWYDRRDGADQEVLLRRVGSDEFYRRTGQRVPLLAARTSIARRRGRAGYPVPLRSWLASLACGEWKADPTDASVTGCFDVFAGDWARDLADRLGVDCKSLLELGRCEDVVGTVTSAGQHTLGLPAGLIWHLGAGDGPCASLGAAAALGADTCLTLGSSGTLRILTQSPVLDTQRRSTALAFLDSRWLVSIPVSNVGFALAWACQALGFADIDELSTAAERGRSDPSLVFLPYLAGERFPYWDPGRAASFRGLRLDHVRFDLARAVVLGIAYSVRRCIDHARELGLSCSAIATNGGATRCKPLLAAIAAATGCELTVTSAGSLEGALHLALPANPLVTARTNAVRPWIDTSDVLEEGYQHFLACSA